LVKFGGEDVGDGVVARFIMRNLVVDIDEVKRLISSDDIYYHRRCSGHGVGKMVNDRDRFVDLCLDISCDKETFVGGVFGVV
jgi:hypothetical protein